MAKPVEERVKEIIVEQLGVEEDEVLPAAKFIEDSGRFSYRRAGDGLQEEFDLEIPDEDAEKIPPSDAISYIKRTRRAGRRRARTPSSRHHRRAVTRSATPPRVLTAADQGKSESGPSPGSTRVPAHRIAGEVKGFDSLRYIDTKDDRKFDPFLKYAVACGVMAVEDAGLNVERVDKTRFGVLVGSGIGGITTLLETHKVLLEKGPDRVSPFFIPMLIVNMASGLISMRFGAKGPNSSVVTACATGNHAIGDATRIIQRGDADIMIAGGSEAIIIPLTIAGFCQMKAMSTRNDDPARRARRSTPPATASCAGKAAASWCWSRWITRWPATRGSTRRWWATA
jgi:acyl carrier protein